MNEGNASVSSVNESLYSEVQHVNVTTGCTILLPRPIKSDRTLRSQRERKKRKQKEVVVMMKSKKKNAKEKDKDN